jgi:hypothetical protein
MLSSTGSQWEAARSTVSTLPTRRSGIPKKGQRLDDDFRKGLQVEAERERGIDHSLQRPGRRPEGAEDANDNQDEPQDQPSCPGPEEGRAQEVESEAEQQPSNRLEQWARHHQRLIGLPHQRPDVRLGKLVSVAERPEGRQAD